MRIIISTFSIFMLLLFSGCGVHSKVEFKETFKKNKLNNSWKVLTDKWSVSDRVLQGDGTQDSWSILLCEKELPEDYILEFYTQLESDEKLLEIILNLHSNKFVGLLNCYNTEIELEDRRLLNEAGLPDIRTVDNIGKFPEVSYASKKGWNKWTIQKAGDSLFIWINGEEVTALTNSNILKDGGQFGFASSGSVKIKDIKLKKSDSLAPKNFTGKFDNRFFFLFGE